MTPLTSSLPDYGYSNVTNCTEAICEVSVDSVDLVNGADVAFYTVIVAAVFFAAFLLLLLFRTRQQMLQQIVSERQTAASVAITALEQGVVLEQWQRAAEENAAERDWWREAWNTVKEETATQQAGLQAEISTLKTVNDEMNRRAAAVGELEVFVRETSKVVQTLEDVAAETNHLALTAAMEAVKAGQHGREFAMVAESIRSLASRSGDAALATAAFVKRGTRSFKNLSLDVSCQ